MGKRVLGSLFDTIFGLITIALSVIGGISFLAQTVHPAEMILYQWISLFLPVLLIINVGLLLYWIIRRKKWFCFPLLALIANFWYYPSLFSFYSDNSNINNKLNSEIVIVTYNVNSFFDKTIGSTISHISDLIKEKNADIVCIQEAPQILIQDSLLRIFPLHTYTVSTKSDDNNFGLLILSKYPITNSDVISFEERPNCVLRADLDIQGNRVSIFNCHLQTTNWNQRRFLRSNRNSSSLFKLKNIMEENFILRAYQSDTISNIIRLSSYPVIICGDFNDTPSSYAYHRIKGDLTDSFSVSENYYSYTYKNMYKLLRIDYLLYSSNMFIGKSYESPDINYSDHNPIIVTLSLKN